MQSNIKPVVGYLNYLHLPYVSSIVIPSWMMESSVYFFWFISPFHIARQCILGTCNPEPNCSGLQAYPSTLLTELNSTDDENQPSYAGWEAEWERNKKNNSKLKKPSKWGFGI